MAVTYANKTFVLDNGERYCILVDRDSGLPAYYATLFVTSQVRNRGKALSTMEQNLAAINVLAVFCKEYGVDLETRLRTCKFLAEHELEGLRDECQKHLRQRQGEGDNIAPMKKGYRKPVKLVRTKTLNIRLARIGDYVFWLANQLIPKPIAPAISKQVAALKTAITARKAVSKGRNRDFETKGISLDGEERLFLVLEPGSEDNPFNDVGIQIRNYVMIKLLRLLGVRGGELLNIRRTDIVWSNSMVNIVRRADAKKDSRKRQPLVKTLSRPLRLSAQVMEEMRIYIVNVRKKIPNSSSHPYLFITHKSGPTEGQPLSISGFREIFRVIADAYPKLACKPHDWRHTWNERFSDEIDSCAINISPEESEKWRNLLMGWTPNSHMGERYNQRYTLRKAHEASLDHQNAFHKNALEAKALADEKVKFNRYK